MASRVPISLNPTNEGQVEKLELGQQISRITHERGSFAGLDENKLAEAPEDENEQFMNVDSENEVADENKEQDVGEEQKEQSFDELRSKLAAKVSAALNETALNLDFVSLLVSASRPQAGESSISPMLKSQTPLASLNAKTIAHPAPAVPAISGYGWKVNAYNRSASSMKAASQRLMVESHKERQFWNDLLTVTSQGEVVNRKMRCVYGYRDSGSSYYDKGIGKFVRENETGHALFKATNSLPQKLVRVSVYADIGNESNIDDFQSPDPERIVGQSVLPFKEMLQGLEEPLLSVRTARNYLFEHELMFQLIQEARNGLAPHRVKLEDGGKVVCEIFGGRIELDMVDDNGEVPQNQTFSNPAHAINFNLHLLQTQRYKAQLEKQHKNPTPMTTKPALTEKNVEDAKVLQPVIAYVHYSILVARTLKLVKIMLPNADIEVKNLEKPSLFVQPRCCIRVSNNSINVSIEVRSPVSKSDEPMVIVSTETKSTEVYDLTELELWLKWVTKMQN